MNIYYKERNLNGFKALIENNKCISFNSSINEERITSYLNQKFDFPFIQRLLYVKDKGLCFKKLDLSLKNIICEPDFNCSLKLLLFIVFLFILKSNDELMLNHNDLTVRNIMFNRRKNDEIIQIKLKDKIYKIQNQCNYYPYIIDFEHSQIFKDKIFLLKENLIEKKYNINHRHNSVFLDIFNFLMSLKLIFKDELYRYKIPDYYLVDRIYDKIFTNQFNIVDIIFVNYDEFITKGIKKDILDIYNSDKINELFEMLMK